MSETGTSDRASTETEKPVPAIEDVKFPPFPDPSDNDFDDDLSQEEKSFYKSKFPDINEIVNVKLHCTACDRHLGCSVRNESRMRPHPMLRTLICHTCHSFYNSGEFDKGEDGSELYCRWCGQGGQVYCCSDCIHVFCAKCIKRNLGVSKIKEIENTDDWKCFKCNPRCLWDLRAVCWALLRFCDIRNKIVSHTEDPDLKEKYQKLISMDLSECCKNKGRRKDKTDSAKKKEKEKEKEVDTKKNIPKLPPTIQVKKFASINLDETPKIEKKALKRPASPKHKIGPGFIQKPITIAPCALSTPPMKKIRMPSAPLLNPVRFANEKKIHNTYSRMPSRPRQNFPIPIVNTSFNGINHSYSMTMPSIMGDNINLSLETLTQGLDMAAVAAYSKAPLPGNNDDVVCTPDFPLEPLCEVTEDNDDDVECITPGPVVPPKITNPPPLVPRTLPDFSSDNIVQMTENDVTVNSITGGLKFRVDPQTLSSKKMYRLPDGRIFAINPNPNMPGGYSATIVSVAEGGGKLAPKGGETYAAKLSAVPSSPTPSRSNSKSHNSNTRKPKAKSTPRPKGHKTNEENRQCDLKVPVEWYRYNLIDAVDALDYSLSRLNKLKKEATTAHLRTRTVDEIKYLHRTLEQLLTTSSKRFLEIRDSLNKELKQYIAKKKASQSNSGALTDDDDDVEFLPNTGNDDPIFIDENSLDSVNINENHDVDLTGAGSSEHNDSTDNKNESDPLQCNEDFTFNKDASDTCTENNSSTVEAQSNLGNTNQNKSETTPTINDKNVANLTDKRAAELNDGQDAEMSDHQDAEVGDGKVAEMGDSNDIDMGDSKDVEMGDSKDVGIGDNNAEVGDLDAEVGDSQDANVGDKQNDNKLVTKLDNEQDANLDKDDANLDKQSAALDKQDGELGEKQKNENNENCKTSDNDDTYKSDNKTIFSEKIGEINGENSKESHNENMIVDSNELSACKDKSDPDDERTQDTDMSEETIERLLKDTDTLDGIDTVSNINRLDVLKELLDKP